MQAAGLRIPGPTEKDSVDSLLSIGERIVETALSGGAESAEAFLLSGIGESYSIEKSSIGYTGGGGESGIGLRVIKDRRVGFAYFTEPDDRSAAVEGALDVARRGQKGDFSFPTGGSFPTVNGLYDPKIDQLGTEEGLAIIESLISGAREVHKGATVSGGSVGFGTDVVAICNSEGLSVGERGTSMGMSAYVVLKEGDQVATGWKSHEANTYCEPMRDPAAIGREASEQAKATLDAEPFGEGRKTTVVFHPHAAAALVEFITVPALFGDKAARGESHYSGKLGEEVVDPRFFVTDDPTRTGGLGAGAFDDEGLASRVVPLLAEGRVDSYLYDLGGAHEYGGGSEAATASGVRSGRLSDSRTYKDPPGVSARNVVFGATDPRPLERLLAHVEDGILAHDLLGAHTANPTSGDFSVSSTTLFRIKDGVLAGAVAPVMLAGNLPELLRGSFVGASVEVEQTSGHFSPTGIEAPYLALSDIHVVG
ncbi:MAG: TldD/PmbA family protein [Euryarchaeota archaeon]|nr:TldD/PmbA family protein [Euryarchaeota archaeon]